MKTCFLTNTSPDCEYLVRRVAETFGPPIRIIEDRPRYQQVKRLLRRRSRIGWSGVLGTVLLRGYSRVFEAEGAGLRGLAPPVVEPLRVRSVNDAAVVQAVRDHASDVVIVLGTSIIHKSVLAQLPKHVINLHGGITPQYRGSNCAVWAMLNDDPDHVGITWHLVDAGVDTGPVLRQVKMRLRPDDTRASIAERQHREAWPPLKDLLEEFAKTGAMKPRPSAAPAAGRLYYTPGLRDYLKFKRMLGSLRGAGGRDRVPRHDEVDHLS